MKALLWIVAVAVIVIGGWLLIKGGNGAPATATGPIKIGVVGPFTGDAAAYGEPLQKTIKLAVDQINTAGGVGGRQIEVVYEDGKCEGKTAASAAQKLVSVDKVQAIIGGFCSGETIPMVPIAAAGKVVVLSPSASSPALTGISPYFFRDYPSDATQGKVLADVAKRDGWKTVAFIQEQTDYAVGVYKAFDDNFKSLGGATINESFPPTATDFRSTLAKLKSQKPDALFIDTQTPAAADRILKQLHELGWKPKLMVSDVVMGDTATFAADKTLLEGVIGAEFIPDASNPAFKQLTDAYKAAYNADLPYQGYMASAYDAVNILRDGIDAVGYDGEKLAGWSRTIKDWPGASGSITIGANGDRASGHSPEIIKDGTKQPLQ